MPNGAVELHVCDPHVASIALTPIPFAQFLSNYDQRGRWDATYETKGDKPVRKL
jgi:hypothetical protein